MTTGINTFTYFSMAVNCAIGAGFLIIPWVFLQLGYFTSILVSIWFFYIAAMQACHQTEAQSRVESMLRMKEDNISTAELNNGKGKKELLINPEEKLDEMGWKYIPVISNRSLVINDLIENTMGKSWLTVWMVFFLLTYAVVLAAQAAMFAAAMTTDVPLWWGDTCNVYDYEGIINECRWKYLVWLGIFTLVCGVLTVIGLEDQKVFQVISAIARILIIGLMFITAVVAIASDAPISEPAANPREELQFNFNSLGISMSIIGFASAYGIIIAPLNSLLINKAHALRVQVFANMAITFAVLLLGVVVAVALEGTNAPSMSNLAWSGYNAGLDPRPWWTYIIEYIIILFPAFNVLTASPLVGLVIADNICKYIKEPSKCTIALLRIAVWIAPFIIALFSHDLGIISSIAGIPIFFQSFGVGSLMHIISKRKIPIKSVYTGW